MLSYDIVYYDTDNERVGEDEVKASDLSAALVLASKYLKRLQGNALVTSVFVEEQDDE